MKSSGMDEFDKRALEAIRSTTFLRPPKIIMQKIEKGEIILGFPL
jgi:outer membrane biosynthesis protein TonB